MRIARDPFESWLEERLVRPTRTLVFVRAVGKVLKLLDRSDTFRIENNFLSIPKSQASADTTWHDKLQGQRHSTSLGGLVVCWHLSW
jgi:hypothetical protein